MPSRLTLKLTESDKTLPSSKIMKIALNPFPTLMHHIKLESTLFSENTWNQLLRITSFSSMNLPSPENATKKLLPNALMPISFKETGTNRPMELWLPVLKIKPDAPPITLNFQHQLKKLSPRNITPMSKTFKELMLNSSRELKENLRLPKLNTKLDKLPWEPISEKLPLKLLPNSDATLNAFTHVENKMTETASRNAIADKEPSLSKRPTSTPTVLSRKNTVTSKTLTKTKLLPLTRPSKDSND